MDLMGEKAKESGETKSCKKQLTKSKKYDIIKKKERGK